MLEGIDQRLTEFLSKHRYLDEIPKVTFKHGTSGFRAK